MDDYFQQLICLMILVVSIAIESIQNRLLKVCYVPATSAGLPRPLFLLRSLTVLMKQTRQAVPAGKQSILLRCLWLCQLKNLFYRFSSFKFFTKCLTLFFSLISMYVGGKH